MPDPAAHTCSKTFSGYPCSHRQWRHPGHCRFVHGYSRSFTVWYRADRLDQHGFVVDFSSLKELERRLRDQFDHTFLANADDPLLDTWRSLHDQGALDLRVMENVGMEASAELVWAWANELVREREGGAGLLLAGGGTRERAQCRLFPGTAHLVPGGGPPRRRALGSPLSRPSPPRCLRPAWPPPGPCSRDC